ncbi:hypothetical protein H1C71_031158, partial [Ictidomys tridecemlineatus]
EKSCAYQTAGTAEVWIYLCVCLQDCPQGLVSAQRVDTSIPYSTLKILSFPKLLSSFQTPLPTALDLVLSSREICYLNEDFPDPSKADPCFCVLCAHSWLLGTGTMQGINILLTVISPEHSTDSGS